LLTESCLGELFRDVSSWILENEETETETETETVPSQYSGNSEDLTLEERWRVEMITPSYREMRRIW
jgi:hypothetical protein